MLGRSEKNSAYIKFLLINKHFLCDLIMLYSLKMLIYSLNKGLYYKERRLMYSKLEDWKNDFFGIELGLSLNEIDELIELLQMIKADDEQHFHISSDYKGQGGIGDIVISQKYEGQKDNIFISGKALASGEEV